MTYVSQEVAVKLLAGAIVIWRLERGPIFKMVPSHSCWLEASVSHWLLAEGLNFLPYRPLHRAAYLPQSEWSKREWGRNCCVFYELPSEVTYYPFCCILSIPPTNLDTMWEVMTHSECLKVVALGHLKS